MHTWDNYRNPSCACAPKVNSKHVVRANCFRCKMHNTSDISGAVPDVLGQLSALILCIHIRTCLYTVHWELNARVKRLRDGEFVNQMQYFGAH